MGLLRPRTTTDVRRPGGSERRPASAAPPGRRSRATRHVLLTDAAPLRSHFVRSENLMVDSAGNDRQHEQVRALRDRLRGARVRLLQRHLPEVLRAEPVTVWGTERTTEERRRRVRGSQLR